jgi:GTPase SAR1 family protein
MTKNHDQAIDKYEDDLLGRQNFVKNLAKSIEQYSGKDSFVIGLYGEWGTGKTSIINMLVDYLQDPKNQTSQEHYKSPIIVKFNPWYFSGQEHLIRQFFNVLSSNLNSSIKKMGQELKDALKTVGKSMKKFAEILEPVNKFDQPNGMHNFGGRGLTNDGTGEESVELITFDKDVDVIKIDIQGSEIYAFKGMEQMIDRCEPWIMFENYENGENDKKVLDFLLSKGYVIYRLMNNLNEDCFAFKPELEKHKKVKIVLECLKDFKYKIHK